MQSKPGAHRSLLATAVAAIIGLVPVALVATPAHAGAGDVTISSDLESLENDTFVFELTREGGSLDPLTLTYATEDGTATAGADYTALSNTTTFAPNSRSLTKKFTVYGLTDALDEDDETFSLRFTGTTAGGQAVDIVAQGILDDDDATPTYSLSLEPNPVAESAGNARIVATLLAVSGRPVTIPVATSNGTAVAGVGMDPGDYTTMNSTISIAAGQPSGYKDVPIIDDAFDEEATETFTVSGSAGNHGEARTGPNVSVQIADNDAMPTVDVAAPGAATEGTQLDFTVTLSAASNRTVTVLASTETGTASAADFTPITNQPVVFSPGDTTETVSVTTQTDLLNELNPEQFKLKLTGTPATGHYTAGAMEANGSISDDDALPVASLSPPSVTEGNVGTTTETFTVTLDAASGREVKIGYAVQGGSATEGEDFEAVTAGDLTFAPGDLTKTFTVKTMGDLKDEPNEDFMVTLSNAAGTASLAPNAVHMITITDDDNLPTLATFGNLTIAEGNAPAAKTIPVTISNPSSLPITLTVTTTNGTAVKNGSGPGSNDLTAPAGTVTIQPGQVSADVTFQVNGDDVYEGNESATIKVERQMGNTAVDAGDLTSTLTLTNDDQKPSVVLHAEAGKKEGQSAAITADVTGVSQDPVTIGLTAVGDAPPGGDAAQPLDFDATTLTAVTSLPGDVISSPYTLGSIDLLTDTIDENTQTVKVALTGLGTTSPVWLSIGDDDNDMLPTIVPPASPVLKNEADGAQLLPVTLDFGQNGNQALSTERKITAAWTTTDGTAKKPADYTSTPGTIEFNPGVTSADIPIGIVQDTQYERTENFTVQLSNALPTGTSIAPTSVTVEILDDDSLQKPVLNGLAAPAQPFREGSAGTANFTVQLDRPATEDVSVRVWITPGTAKTGDATPGNDDYTTPVTPVTIPATEDHITVPVTIKGDTVYESTETATVHIELAGGEADAVDAQSPVTATLTITDDDAMPTVTLNSVTAAEGSGPQNIVGTVSGVTQDPIQVSLAAVGAVNGTSDPAEPSDFDPAGLGATTIPGGTIAGGLTTLGTISFLNDKADEYDETVKVTMTGLAAPVSSWNTITDNADDLPPAIKLPATATGFENVTPLQVAATLDFTDSMDATSTQKTLSAVYSTLPGTAKTPGDYTPPVLNSKVTFDPGDTTKNVPVTIVNDLIFERSETFTLKITTPAPTGVTLGNDITTVTITDDDDTRKPTFSVTDAPFTEGATGGKAVFTVNLSYASTEAVDFDVAMNDDTAIRAGTGPGYQDYTMPAGTVTVPAGQSSVTIEVPVNNDTVYEGATAEKATLSVSLDEDEDDATGPTASGELRITDNDDKPSIELTPSSGSEGTDLKVLAKVTGVAQNDFPFDVTFDGDSSDDQNPAEDVDYTDNGVSGVIPGGTVSGRTLTLGTVSLNQDQIDEPAEYFMITATDQDDADRYVSASYRINDDPNDLPPTVAVDELTTIDEDLGTVDVHVKLSFDSDATSTEQVVSVGWKTTDGTAKAAYDYLADNGTLTFEPGVTDLSANVPIANDTVDEPTQSFWVTLSSALPKGVVIDQDTGEVQILDNDATEGPTLIAPVSRVGTGPVVVTGKAAEGVQVRIYAAAPSTPTKWFLAATTATNLNGLYSASIPFDMGYYLQARVGASTSATKLVKVVQVPVLTATSTLAGTVNLTVAGNPKQAGLGVTIQRKNANGSWSNVITGTTAGTAKTFAYALKGQKSGTTITFRATIAANTTWGTLLGTSVEKPVRVR